MLLGVTADDLVPADHPIRRIKPIVQRALGALSPMFARMYAPNGRKSIPPEHLLKANVLIELYSIRSERQFCERLQYDLLFKWFLDLNISDRAFEASTFSKNRKRLLDHQVAAGFAKAVLAEAYAHGLLSGEHFTVDGTLLESWASLRSLHPRAEEDGPADGPNGPSARGGRDTLVNFRGEHRSNVTHVSMTDPEARLARKGSDRSARLCFAGHVLMDNRHGLVVDVLITQPSGWAEREAALVMLDRRPRRSRRVTLGADKGYDTREFVTACRARRVTPHVTQDVSRRRGGGWRRSAIDQRTTRHAGYALSQRVRKRVEEIFGWAKTVGGARKLRYIGIARNQLWAELTVAAYNLVRMAKLVPSTA
jgi:transposase/IS5 family transposase